MQRRAFLYSMAAAATAAASLSARRSHGDTWTDRESVDPDRRAAYYVPGYHPEYAFYKGGSIILHPDFNSHIPAGYKDRVTLMARVDERDGSVRRNVFPVRGHDIAVRADGRHAVFNSQNGTTMVSFDPVSLEMDVYLEFEASMAGGGHSVYLPDGNTMAVTERQIYRPFSGRAADHYGRIGIRDNTTLKLLETYDCQAIAPHEVNLTADGKHLVVASYGSTNWPEHEEGPHRYIVEPAISVLELASGKLVDRYVPEAADSEYRHLAAYSLDRIFVLQNAKSSFKDVHELMATRDDVYLPDLLGEDNLGDVPKPVVRADFSSGRDIRQVGSRDARQMVRAQSITYDPVHDEVIASFTTSNYLLVLAGADGSLKRAIETTTMGLRLPRGIVLHPDGLHYAVGGGWNDIYLFERGSHRLVRERCQYTYNFEHSHITAVAI